MIAVRAVHDGIRPGALVRVLLLAALLVLPATIAFSAEPVRLTYWNLFTTGDLRVGMMEAVQAFNASRSDIRIEVLDVPLIEDKLPMTVAGGAPPDIVLFDRFRVAQFAALGTFMALDDFIARDGVKRDDYFHAAWDECVFRGRTWGLPYNTDVRVLFWNKRLFREAGLDRPPRDWDELVEFSKRLTLPADRNAPLKQVGFVPLFGNTWLYLYGWQKGATFLDAQGNIVINEPQTVAALEWMQKFVEWYGADRIRRFEGGFGANALNPFIIEKIAMVGDEVSLLSAISRYRPDLEYDVAPLPWPKDGVHATWSGGMAMVIPRGARHPAQSWEFIKFMCGRDAQTTFGITAVGLPANRLATEHPFYQNDPKWRVMISEMEYSKFRPLSVVGGTVWEAMVRARDYVSFGLKTPKQALDEGQAQIDAALREATASERLPLVDWPRTLAWLLPLLGVAAAARIAVSVRRYRRENYYKREGRWAYLMAAPVILGFFIFSAGPILASALLCFTSYDVLNPARVAGLGNFARMFAEDELLPRAIWNTFVYVILAVPIGLLVALGAAILINQPLRGRAFFRSVFFLPVVTPVIAGSLLWMWLFNSEYGMLNVLLTPVVESAPVQALAAGLSALIRLFSFVSPELAEVNLVPRVPNWLVDPFWAKPAIVIMTVWGFGQAMVIFLAGLQRIPEQLYEAATIDGASTWQKMRFVTLPLLSPTIFFNLVIALIGALQVFAQIFVVTYGGPADSTRFYVLHLYWEAFIHLRMGYASALAWVLFIVILLLTLAQFRIAKRWVHYE